MAAVFGRAPLAARWRRQWRSCHVGLPSRPFAAGGGAGRAAFRDTRRADGAEVGLKPDRGRAAVNSASQNTVPRRPGASVICDPLYLYRSQITTDNVTMKGRF